jgi:SAM-dependent methyltransferase
MANENKGDLPQSNVWSSSEAAEHWQQDLDRRRQDMAEATKRMLESAGLKPGDHVLDIAAGTGDQSVLAARMVEPGGSVLATDISADMLNIAARVAEAEGLTTITTRVMDAEQLDLEDNAFDAVICRLGLMLMPHPQQALREIHRVLKPGGKLAALVWSTAEHNPLFSLSLAIVSRYAGEAPSGLPNPLSLSGPNVFPQELAQAGFHDVVTQAIPFESHYASLDAFLHSTADRVIAGAMGKHSPSEQQQLVREVREAVSQFDGPHGFVAPAEFLLGVGTK